VNFKRARKLINNAMLKLDKKGYEILYELCFKHNPHQLSKNLGTSRPAIRCRGDKALKQLKTIILK